MADNLNVTPGTGSIVAADDIGGILHQRVKLVIGADGVSNGDVSSANPIPTTATTNGTVGAGTAGTNSGLVGGVFNTTKPVLTTGQQAALQTNKNGILKVDTDMAESYGAGSVVIAADIASVTTIGANGQEIYSGTPTSGSSAQFLVLNLASKPNSVKMQISTTWVGTLSIEGSMDAGVTYFKVPFVQDNGAATSTLTANAVGNVNTMGLDRVRVRAISLTSGTPQANATFSNATSSVFIANTNRSAWVKDGLGNDINSLDDGNGGKALEVAMAATNFVFSAVNSSTVQLAAAATFNGAIETVVNQQTASILLTSNQNGTLVLTEYIDAAGTRVSRATTYATVASVPFSRSFVLNGNYFKAAFTNNGASTTTTFNLNTAYGTIPSATALGNGQVSLDEVNGTAFSLGQKTSALSLPVVIGSDQSPVTIMPVANNLIVSTTAATGVGLTATLPAVASQFHYIDAIEVTLYSTAARTGSATPIVVTSTNLPGSYATTWGTAAAIGDATVRQLLNSDRSVKSSVVNTATTIVCPVVTGGIWRINIVYSTGT